MKVKILTSFLEYETLKLYQSDSIYDMSIKDAKYYKLKGLIEILGTK